MCTYDAAADTIHWCEHEHIVSAPVARAAERQTQQALAELPPQR